MFFHKKEKPIDLQIRVFIHDLITNGSREGNYHFWLNEFVNLTGVEDVFDIEKEHIDSFLTDVSCLYNGQLSLQQAERAVKAMVVYYMARRKSYERKAGIMYNRGASMEENQKRNRELVMLRSKDPAKWTWRALGERFNIHFTRAKEIYEDYADRYIKGYPQGRA